MGSPSSPALSVARALGCKSRAFQVKTFECCRKPGHSAPFELLSIQVKPLECSIFKDWFLQGQMLRLLIALEGALKLLLFANEVLVLVRPRVTMNYRQNSSKVGIPAAMKPPSLNPQGPRQGRRRHHRSHRIALESLS